MGVRFGLGWDGIGWDGTGWDGTGWDGTGWDGVGWDGMACVCFIYFSIWYINRLSAMRNLFGFPVYSVSLFLRWRTQLHAVMVMDAETRGERLSAVAFRLDSVRIRESLCRTHPRCLGRVHTVFQSRVLVPECEGPRWLCHADAETNSRCLSRSRDR